MKKVNCIAGFVFGFIFMGGLCFLQIKALQNDYGQVIDQNGALEKANINMRAVIDAQRSIPIAITYNYEGPHSYSDIRKIITTENQLVEFMKAKNLTDVIAPSDLYRMSAINNIDPGFVLATFIAEVGWSADSESFIVGNNPSGIRCGIEYCEYSSVEKGFDATVSLLRSYTEGLYGYPRFMPADIRVKWAEANGTEEVVAIWQQIVGDIYE